VYYLFANAYYRYNVKPYQWTVPQLSIMIIYSSTCLIWPSKYKRKRTSCLWFTLSHKQRNTQNGEEIKNLRTLYTTFSLLFWPFVFSILFSIIAPFGKLSSSFLTFPFNYASVCVITTMLNPLIYPLLIHIGRKHTHTT